MVHFIISIMLIIIILSIPGLSITDKEKVKNMNQFSNYSTNTIFLTRDEKLGP